MTKRVLALLLVIAMVLSLMPTVVLAEGEAATPGYEMILQKAHNQTEGELAVDVYLKATTAEQKDVTTFQLKVTPAEGWVLSAPTSEGLSMNGETGVILYDALNAPAIAVGTDKVLVATICVVAPEGAEAPAKLQDALSISEEAVTNADAAEYVPALVWVDGACDHACGHGEGEWKAFESTGGTLAAGNYYLTSDVQLTKELNIAKDAEVSICLNGFDIEAASGKFLINVAADTAATLNICDCTATGEGVNYTSGKLLPKVNNGGAIRCSIDAKTTVNVYGGTIDGSKHEMADKESPAVFINATNTFNMFGGKVENFTGMKDKNGACFGALMFRGTEAGECFATIENVTFVNCGTAALSAPYGSSGVTGAKDDTVTLVVRDVTITGSKDGARAIDINDVYGGKFKSVTIEGDCKFDAPVYLASGESVILNLGANADVNIVTEKDLTQEEFNKSVKMAEGGSLTAGTVLYENAGVFVTYADGQFVFEEGHIHMGKVFKAWDKTDSLPKEGNWYLLHDVTVEGGTLNVEHELNLDLNGKTITGNSDRLYSVWVATFNLYDSSSTYDEDGNWVSGGTGKITGITKNEGAVLQLNTGAVMNMYGGTITGNSSNNGMIYMQSVASKRNQNGAVFNMYGGEFSNNTSTYYGSAISVNCADGVALPEGKERAEINIYGGKLSDNTAKNASGSQGYGVIRAVNYVDITVYGGEFSGNTSATAGVFYMTGDSTLAIYGGKFADNAASAYRKVNADQSESIQHGQGGVVYMSNTAQLTIAENEESRAAIEFSNNSAHQGGVIYVANSGNNVDISAGTFEENKAVAVTYKVLTSGALTDKTTSGTGGVLYLNAGTATVKDISATKNSGNGAVFYVRGDASLSAEDSVFTANTANNAAVAYVTNTSSATFKNCSMTGNISTSNGSAIRVDGSAELTLEDTTITGNYTSDGGVWACGALYHTGAGQKVILKGATMIVGNTSKQNPLSADYVFQGNNNAPTVYVNELTDGAHVNIYNMSADNRAAADLVKIAEGGSQTDWDCGWINYYESTGKNDNSTYAAVAPKSVSRNNEGVFVFGHWHNVNGTMVEYTAITKPAELNSAAANGYYYLTTDVSMGNWGGNCGWRPNDGVTLCLNGYDVITTTDHAIGFTATTARTATVQDCVGYYDLNDEYIGGGVTSAKTHKRTGAGIYFSGAAHTLNWEGGKLYGFTVLNDGTGDTNGAVIFMASSIGAILNFKGGAVCDNLSTDASADVTAKNKVSIIQMNSGKLTITGGSFYRNQNLTLTSGAAHGGVIRVAGGTLSVKNAKFFDNVAGTRGGAISCDNAFGVSNSVFRNNTAQNGHGGAIYFSKTATINNCTFEGNSASGDGGAVYVFNTLTINNSVFEDNTAARGGAVWNSQNTTATNVTFKNNSANQGGAIFAQDSASSDKSTTIIKTADGGTSLFEGNTAAEGGAIYATVVNDKAVDVQLTGTTFKNNGNTVANEDGIPVTTRGGAVYMNGAATLSVCTDNVFEGNSANNGGAIYTQRAITNINGTTFKKNHATSYGGAIYSDIYATGTTTIENNTVFDGNTAGSSAGAIYSATKGSGTERTLNLTVKNSTFKNNSGNTKAWAMGGTIVARNTTRMTFTNVLFEGNEGYHGAAIYTAESGCQIKATDCTFRNNTAKYTGGAIYALWGYTANTLDNCTFDGNEATTGGAITTLGNNNFKMTIGGTTACTFTNNTATYGGALAAMNTSSAAPTTVIVANATFTGNTASQGGAIYTGTGEKGGTSACNLTIQNAVIENNTATSAGAAIAVTGKNAVTVKDTTIQNNQDKGYFGAIYIENSTPSLTLSGKMIVKNNSGNTYAVDNLHFRDVEGKDPVVTFDKLTADSEIGIQVTNNRYKTVPALGTVILAEGVSREDMNKVFTSDAEDRFLTYVTADGELKVVNYIYDDGTTAQTLQEVINKAIEAGETKVTLQAGGRIEDSVNVNANLTIDMNGRRVKQFTVAEGKTISLIDTTTDRYTDSNNSVVVDGAYEAYTETNEGGLKRYLTVENADGSVSVSRIYLAINTKLLRTFNKGIGFKAIYAGNSAIANAIANGNVQYGIQLSYDKDFRDQYTKSGDFTTKGFTAGIENANGTPNQRTAVVYNVLFDGAENNQANADDILYGRPYIAVEGVVVATGAIVETSLSAMAKAAKSSTDTMVTETIAAWEETYGVNFG